MTTEPSKEPTSPASAPPPCSCGAEITTDKCMGQFALAPKDCGCAYGRCLRDEPERCPDAYPLHDGFREGWNAALAESRAETARLVSRVAELDNENQRFMREVARLRALGPFPDITAEQAGFRSPPATGEDRQTAITATFGSFITEADIPRLFVECSRCGGSGFTGPESGYGGVCSECGGQKMLPYDDLTAVIAAAHARGVREGIEKAAQIADNEWPDHVAVPNDYSGQCIKVHSQSIARRIRALTNPEPQEEKL